MRGITKRYPGVVANDGIDLEIRPGEIHALLGENGAGKSTLMNILYGLAGRTRARSCSTASRSTIDGPTDAIARGISMVHQHFMLVPVLTVAENILLGEETMANRGLPRPQGGAAGASVELGRPVRLRDRPRREGRHACRSAGSSGSRSSRRSTATRASSSSTSRPRCSRPQETEEIFAVLRRLAAEGHSIVFISHKLYEVLEIADRITVIRRGKVVGQRAPGETDEDDLAELMVGREVQLTVDRGESPPGGDASSRSRASRSRTTAARGRPTGSTLDVRAGEILGIAGVAGNGQDELVEAITGLRKPSARRRHPDGRRHHRLGPARAARARASAFVPGDRHRFGLVL